MTTLNSVITSVLMNTTGKVMSALGVGFVSYKGLDTMQQKFVGLLMDKLDDLPQAALQLIYIVGIGEYLNYMLSGYAFALTIKSTTHLTARLKN